jgi:hypothetical protein
MCEDRRATMPGGRLSYRTP